jgi:putative two-component system response regulator
LDDRVQERTRQLAQAELDTVECLARAAEYRDDDTGQHAQRVGHTAAMLARRLGLEEQRVQLIRRAAPLHDVGKIGIPDAILLKSGKLTPEEFTVMKTHATIGFEIMTRHHTPLLQLAASLAHTHHERWDGTGYPQGLAGEAIPLEGLLVAVADVFDALTHRRPYKEAWPVGDAVEEICRQGGRQFAPEVVAAFLSLQHEDLV